MKKLQKSIRLSEKAQMVLKRKIARVTLNPALYAISLDYVDWGGRKKKSAKLPPSELALLARKRFPDLPLSWAIEGYIALLTSESKESLAPISVDPYDEIPESVCRFRSLSPLEKIQVGERWKRELETLRNSL